MRALLVVAHPLDDSFTKAAARRIARTFETRGLEVDLLDLYAEGFDPRLTEAERRSYFATCYYSTGVRTYVDRLERARKLVLVFPQWWFGVPAILKGFFDRVLAPGAAFDLPVGGGMPAPRLGGLDSLVVVTSTGAPWWITKLYMGDPVRRQIARGIKPFVNPKARFRMFALHDMDHMTRSRAEAFLDRIERAFMTL
jgi:putative NADPH-quinone reductase